MDEADGGWGRRTCPGLPRQSWIRTPTCWTSGCAARRLARGPEPCHERSGRPRPSAAGSGHGRIDTRQARSRSGPPCSARHPSRTRGSRRGVRRARPRNAVDRRPERDATGRRDRPRPRAGAGRRAVPVPRRAPDRTRPSIGTAGELRRATDRFGQFRRPEAFQQLGERGVGAGLGQQDAAVDHERLAGDVARPVGREEQHGFGDLVGVSDPAERDRLGDRVEHVGNLLPHRGERRADVARARRS